MTSIVKIAASQKGLFSQLSKKFGKEAVTEARELQNQGKDYGLIRHIINQKYSSTAPKYEYIIRFSKDLSRSEARDFQKSVHLPLEKWRKNK
jgi:hypothetical protein